MKHIIVGTAGHIDHGKTTLIRALTGVNTDRLGEEQKRGISIELGFSHFDLSEEERIGIIDVPGHEKFLKNMLAGVADVAQKTVPPVIKAVAKTGTARLHPHIAGRRLKGKIMAAYRYG